jgi:hypothetical protein
MSRFMVSFECRDAQAGAETAIQFASLELSVKNREFLRLTVTREPRSGSELAEMAHRPPQNVPRTLRLLRAPDRLHGVEPEPILPARQPSRRWRRKVPSTQQRRRIADPIEQIPPRNPALLTVMVSTHGKLRIARLDR